jgi:hypothetical protein
MSAFLIDVGFCEFRDAEAVLVSAFPSLIITDEGRRSRTYISSILSRLIPFVSGIRNQTKKNMAKQQEPKKKYVP